MSGRKRQSVNKDVPFPAQEHDHASCVRDALAEAAKLCASRGAQLTEQRARVLELVWNSHRPVGAYEILERLAGNGRKPAPPTVYRALEFLLEQKLVHRIESLNAYIGCSAPGHAADQEILICRECGRAAEISDARVSEALSHAVARRGFSIERRTIEIVGLCGDCQHIGAKPNSHAHKDARGHHHHD